MGIVQCNKGDFMTKKLILSLILMISSACTVKTGNDAQDTPPAPPQEKPQRVSSPESQPLAVSADEAGGFNQVTRWDYAGGDLTHYFPFTSKVDGELTIRAGSVSGSNCQYDQMVEVFRFETLENNATSRSVVLNKANATQRIEKGRNYQVKISLNGLGSCEFIAYDFSAKFVETKIARLGSKPILVGDVVSFYPSGRENFTIDLTYTTSQTQNLSIYQYGVWGGDECLGRKESLEWLTLDSSGNVLSSQPKERYSSFPAQANAIHVLRLTVTNAVGCPSLTYSLGFTSDRL
jgi:hypothetical protein